MFFVTRRAPVVAALLGTLASQIAHAAQQELVLWVDRQTAQVFLQPGPGRVPLKLGGATYDAAALAGAIAAPAAPAATAPAVSGAVASVTANAPAPAPAPVAADAGPASWVNHIKLSTLVYADWGMYQNTGFGPQFLTQVNPPGPGNDGFNAFDVTRAYLNFLFTPDDDWLIRLTPNIYRAVGASTADKSGRSGAIGSNLDGNLNFRLKYAYLQYNKAFQDIPALRGDTVTLGQQMNPFIDWQEALYGFRFVNLVPWNYTGLSSTQAGLSAQGPIAIGGVKYLDYDVGVYDNASFRAFEQSAEKQAMVRLSYYPFGYTGRFNGLGMTAFYDRGHGNATPDTNITTPFRGPDSAIERGAFLVHYASDAWALAGEYDWGRNAFTPGNLFSGSGPGDVFGVATGYAGLAALANGVLNTGTSRQEGYDFFGRYRIGATPFTLFGTYQRFLPNTHVVVDPFDFERFVGGVAYDYSKYLRFALDTQHLVYSQDQFTFPATPGVTPIAVANAVPDDIHAWFLNLEFKY
jgi:hypothetical protein